MKFPRMFFLDEKLYRKEHINRAGDELYAWSFQESRLVTLPYSYVRDNYDQAFSARDVSKVLNRGYTYIRNLVFAGTIDATDWRRTMTTGDRHGPYWSPKGLMELRDYFASQHRGRPRNDGLKTPQAIPTRRELRAMLDRGVVLYAKDDAGNFVPTWKA